MSRVEGLAIRFHGTNPLMRRGSGELGVDAGQGRVAFKVFKCDWA